ncbi:hypothetical protein AAMO2058_001529400 [Amorphochlora amoebiformis]
MTTTVKSGQYRKRARHGSNTDERGSEYIQWAGRQEKNRSTSSDGGRNGEYGGYSKRFRAGLGPNHRVNSDSKAGSDQRPPPTKTASSRPSNSISSSKLSRTSREMAARAAVSASGPNLASGIAAYKGIQAVSQHPNGGVFTTTPRRAWTNVPQSPSTTSTSTASWPQMENSMSYRMRQAGVTVAAGVEQDGSGSISGSGVSSGNSTYSAHPPTVSSLSGNGSSGRGNGNQNTNSNGAWNDAPSPSRPNATIKVNNTFSLRGVHPPPTPTPTGSSSESGTGTDDSRRVRIAPSDHAMITTSRPRMRSGSNGNKKKKNGNVGGANHAITIHMSANHVTSGPVSNGENVTANGGSSVMIVHTGYGPGERRIPTTAATGYFTLPPTPPMGSSQMMAGGAYYAKVGVGRGMLHHNGENGTIKRRVDMGDNLLLSLAYASSLVDGRGGPRNESKVNSTVSDSSHIVSSHRRPSTLNPLPSPSTSSHLHATGAIPILGQPPISMGYPTAYKQAHHLVTVGHNSTRAAMMTHANGITYTYPPRAASSSSSDVSERSWSTASITPQRVGIVPARVPIRGMTSTWVPANAITQATAALVLPDGDRRRRRRDDSRKSSKAKSFPCTFEGCQDAFSTRFSLKRHMKKHTGERPFECPYKCGKSFAEKSTLTRHVRVHTGKRPYVCKFPGCEKSFADRTNIKRHELLHTGKRPYRCCYCARGFFYPKQVIKHISELHKDQVQVASVVQTR